MARPIEPTPKLEGKYAEEFVESVLNFKPDRKVVEVIERCIAVRNKSKY